MLVNIKDISGMFCEFWEKAEKLSLKEKKFLWKQIYEVPNKDIFGHLEYIFKLGIKDYDIDNSLEECFERYAPIYGNIKVFSEVIKYEVDKICKACRELFNINDLELNFVTMLGNSMPMQWLHPLTGQLLFIFWSKCLSEGI